MRKILVAFLAALALPAIATVPSTTSSVSYTCNGTTTVYAVPFRFLDPSHLEVSRASGGVTTSLVLTTDYTVQNTGLVTGGSITLAAGSRCGSGYTLTVKRTVPLTQTTSLRSQGAYSPAAQENALDRLAMADQQLQRQRDDDVAAQDVRDDAQEADIANLALGTPSASSAQVTATGGPTKSLATWTATGPVSASDTTVTATGSSTARALRDRAGEIANVRDHGAKGDWTEPSGAGATDDTAAFQAAIDSGKPVYVPPGVYYIAGTLKLPTYPTAVRIFGYNHKYDATGARGTTHIHVSSAALFQPLVASTYSSISKASIQLSGISFQATTGSNSVAFDRVMLTASRITECQFHNFKHVLYGALVGVSHFDRNVVANMLNSAFKRLASVDFDPNLTAPLVDSEITDNYINGSPLVAVPDFYLLDIDAANSSLISGNYLDFAFGGIKTGGANGLITISGNTFDILYRAIEFTYGTFSVSVSGNRFFRIRKASASYFSFPTAAMSANDWTCVYFPQHVREVTVANNVHRDSERFMDLPAKWYKNIREWGTVGRTLTSPVVRMVGRTVDEAGYNGIGETGDGTGFFFESMHMTERSTWPNAVTASYEGHAWFHSGVFVRTRGGLFMDENGRSVWGRPNELHAVDFSAGWTPVAGMTISAGVATLDGSTSGWKFGDALGTPLAPGTYVVIWTISARTSGSGTYLSGGLKLSDASTVTPTDAVAAGTGDSPAGTYYGTVVVPAGKTGTNAAIYSNTSFAGSVSQLRILNFSALPATPGPAGDTVSADRGDASVTLTARVDAPTQRWATTLTANRTVTLSTTGARNGDVFRVVRTGLGAFTLDVGGLKTIPSATAAFVDVAYNGSAWVLIGYGTL